MQRNKSIYVKYISCVSNVKGVAPDIDKAEGNYLDQCPQKEEKNKY